MELNSESRPAATFLLIAKIPIYRYHHYALSMK